MIGSAAVALHGADPGPVCDVDVLIDGDDAQRLLPTLGLLATEGMPDDLFRSAIFARWTVSPVPVEFMAGLEIRDATGWHAVCPATRVAVGDVFVPDRRELGAILRCFGREKDRRRAALLD